MKHIVLFEKFKIKKDYLGQCDTLRRISEENEIKWINMMKDKIKISFKVFVLNINPNNFIDDDENISDYLLYCKKEDPETSTYMSYWGDKECFFIQTCGFEFIFV